MGEGGLGGRGWVCAATTSFFILVGDLVFTCVYVLFFLLSARLACHHMSFARIPTIGFERNHYGFACTKLHFKWHTGSSVLTIIYMFFDDEKIGLLM